MYGGRILSSLFEFLYFSADQLIFVVDIVLLLGPSLSLGSVGSALQLFPPHYTFSD